MIGKTIAHYTVVEKLGEGGMGVVYKARDTHLDRFVALKVLPPDKVGDANRKLRFIQEAKAASALNHPNIVKIYDIAEADGVLFIAMEYIAGKSLDQVIGRGLRPGDVLKHSVQVADALANAHQAEIVHRDLKPQNIMISDDGQAKILDFGLAKLGEQDGDAVDDDVTAADKPKTQDGQILGTVAFMSPEQAEGRKVDSRSDIFSFGAVLYEMVTARRAFQGASHAATLAAVLREEPKPVHEVIAAIPSELERIIARCLRKDPDRRFQSMADLRVSLQELKEESDSGRLGNVGPSAARAHRLDTRRSSLVAITLALGAIAIVAAAILAYVINDRRNRAQTPAVAYKPVPLTALPGRELAPSLSPDGNQVAFSWDGENGVSHIYIKLVGPGRPLRLTNESLPDSGPAWSPDGRFIAFYRASKMETRPGHLSLLLIPALGGSERKLAEFDIQPYLNASPAWSIDSKYLIVSARAGDQPNNSLYRCSIDTGELTRLTEPPNVETHGDDAPAMAPDGRALAFVRSSVNANGRLYVLPWPVEGATLPTPRQVELGTFSAFRLAWTADSRELVVDNGARRPLLARVRADGSGTVEPIALRDAAYVSISARANRMVYSEVRIDVDVWEADLTWSGGVPRADAEWRLLTAQGNRKINSRYSPQGNRIAFSSNRIGNQEIWTADADGSNAAPLTSSNAQAAGSPHWSPDGSRIAFDMDLLGTTSDIFTVPADGGKPVRLTSVGRNITPTWTADGQRLYFASNRSGRLEVWTMSANGENQRQVTHEGGFGPALSRDGRTLFYVRGEGNRKRLLKMPIDGGAEEEITDDLENFSFAPADHGVFYLVVGMQLSIKYIDFTTGKKTEVLSGGQRPEIGLALSADGRRIMFSKVDQIDADLMLVENFR